MNLEGTWHNEFGSTMIVNAVRDGGFSGAYTTAVSPTGCAQGSFQLVGQTDTDNGGEAVAFVVCWQNDYFQLPVGNCVVRPSTEHKWGRPDNRNVALHGRKLARARTKQRSHP